MIDSFNTVMYFNSFACVGESVTEPINLIPVVLDAASGGPEVWKGDTL